MNCLAKAVVTILENLADILSIPALCVLSVSECIQDKFISEVEEEV